MLVFVHGGGFTAGAGSLYDPSKLVERGNMVVTLNYRLGVLGFLDHPRLSDPFAGNFGLADQQAALRWIRRNAAAFGGDASNVTLWGESAGAFSTCAQLVAPAARGLFQKAIVQSGPCANEFVTRPVAQKRGLATAAELGCQDPRSAAECSRNKPIRAQLMGMLGDEPSKVWVERIAVCCLDLVGGPPTGLAEFGWVGGEGHTALSDQEEPQTDVGVAMVPADCFGDGDEARLAPWMSKGRVDAELFLCLTPGGVCWMFAGFDVTSWRQPELRVEVVDQQAASIAWIDQDDV